ncbi:DHA2 family efflux MFS transporter permease subunit [Actinopolymorpha alba]|uniref:DHA2 family efflux MFS transporter permease subunit n=1 Tax=Actinopolymorpha alba TaxID=533267 RepID=UPI00036466AE|nr:DHA2 family efflux MFS transporter permease subunit [Actinopolymorpha alba]
MPDTSSPVAAGRRRWITVITVSVALFMVTLDNLIVIVGLPSIRESLGASLESLEWTVNAYTLAFAVALIPAAALGDRFGRRRLFLVGLLLFTASSAAAALATTAGALIVARMAQGIGGAIIAPLTLTLLAAGVPRERRGLAIGIWSAISGIGVALGPLVGGAVIEAASWQWIFWINVPVGLVLLPVAGFLLRESFGPQGRLDIVGFGLVALGLSGVVFGLVRANAAGWSSPEIIGTLGGGAVVLALFVWWEHRAATPMVPLNLFASRGFAVTNLAGLFMMFGTFGSIFLLTQLLQGLFGYGPLEAGLRMLVWTGATLLVAPLAGPMAERFGPRPFMAAGLALQATALYWIAAVSEVGMAWTPLIPPFALAGAGMALSFAPSASAVLASVRPERAGQASGVNNAVREVGGVFGIAVLGTIFAHNGGFSSPQALLDGTAPAVVAGASVTAAGALIALLHPRKAARLRGAARPGAAPDPAASGQSTPEPAPVGT